MSNLRPVRWIVLTFPNAKDTAPTANSSHARRGSSAASGCPILRTAAAPGRWLRTRMRQPSTTWCCRPSWPKERPPSGSCAGCWDSPEDAENARRPTRRRKSRKRGNPARPDSDAVADGKAAGHRRFRVQHRPARQPLRLGHRTIHDTRNTVRSAPHRTHARRIVRAHLRTPPPSFSRRCGRQPAENHRRFPGGVTPQPYHGAPRPVRGSAAPRLRAYVFPAGRTRTGAHRLIPAASCILPATWSHRTEGGPGTDRKRRLTATGRPRPGTRAGNGIRSGKERRAGYAPTREAAASS